jgi:hypothetical protein
MVLQNSIENKHAHGRNNKLTQKQRPLRITDRERKDNIKMNPREMGCEGVD